jgi:ApaG protein
MKSPALALSVFLVQAASFGHVSAFVPTSRQFLQVRTSVTTVDINSNSHGSNALDHVALLARQGNTSLQAGAGFLGMDEDDEDEDDEDEGVEDDDEDEDEDDEDVALSSSRYSGAKSPFTGVKLDPYDPNPLIKPRPSRYFREPTMEVSTVADGDLAQTLSADERAENLKIMRQIKKSDLPDLRMRKDHAGWVEANNELKRRYDQDPWFGVNERLRQAFLLGEPQEKIDNLRQLGAKLGGLCPGIEGVGVKGYAVHSEIYDVGISPSRAASVMERQVRMERAARGRVMMQERKKNIDKEQRQYEEDMRNPGVREDKEAKERRERTMRRLMDQIDEDNKKKRERAQEILGKVPDTPESRTKSMEKALKEARDEVKLARRKQLGMASSRDDDDDLALVESPEVKSGADKAREAAAAEASGGRPRLPGDGDVTRGDLGGLGVESSSTTVTGPLQVEVTSIYNKEQSDPPMRKHCFQYTIRITNNSPTDTIQLLGRRFEIQTVGSSMKDIVQGEGVTGRTPVLAPGEVFEYTSTAPLSVRPIGTTEIAARMRGEYRFVTLTEGQETASEEQMATGGEATAELGMFHFIFPQDQRVQPIRSADVDDDDEDEEEDEPTAKPVTPMASTPSASGSPASTLPGDIDMTTGDVTVALNDSSEAVTQAVRVQVTSSYRPERSDDALDKHCFAYNIRITNESEKPIQLVSRRFEIQTIGGSNKDVVQGPGVTGRQPILKPGESFEYTSTAPLSVKPKIGKTPAVARMQGEYNFVVLGDDGATPISSTPLQAKLGMFHFILPDSSVA